MRAGSRSDSCEEHCFESLLPGKTLCARVWVTRVRPRLIHSLDIVVGRCPGVPEVWKLLH